MMIVIFIFHTPFISYKHLLSECLFRVSTIAFVLIETPQVCCFFFRLFVFFFASLSRQGQTRFSFRFVVFFVVSYLCSHSIVLISAFTTFLLRLFFLNSLRYLFVVSHLDFDTSGSCVCHKQNLIIKNSSCNQFSEWWRWQSWLLIGPEKSHMYAKRPKRPDQSPYRPAVWREFYL